MQRLFLITCLVLFAGALSAPAALADQPEHFVRQTFSITFSFPAGTFCDFNYQDDVTLVDTGVLFDDGSAVINETQYNTHMNLDTGYTLTEVDQISFQFHASGGRFQFVGLFWHLRDPDGRIVVVQAGQELFDTETGELLRVTPNLNPDNAAVICPALGGQPAI